MGARFLRLVCLIFLLAPTLLQAEARAETETELIHRRATLTLKHLADELDLIEDQWRKEFLKEELHGGNGERLTEEAISRPLVVQQENIARALAGQKSHFESWQAGRSDARHVRSSAVRSVQGAVEGCWAVELKKAEFRVKATSQAYKRKREELSTERERRLGALGRKRATGSTDRELREARIETAIAQKEEAIVAGILDRYGRAAKDLADRRRLLCRETWRWESFFKNLNRKEEAKSFRILVYSQFAVGLADRSVGLHKDLFAYHTSRDSRLDQFVRDLSHPDRLVFSDTIDTIDSILLHDRVESLKTEDCTEPPVSVAGSPLEKLIHALSTLLGEMHGLQESQKSLTAQLANLNADHGDAAFAGKELAEIEREMAHAFGALAANDGQLMKITARVTRLRSVAAIVIGLTARQLGLGSSDPFIKKLDETRTVLDQLDAHIAIGLSRTVPVQVEQISLQKILDMSIDNESLGRLAEGKSRVATLKNTMSILGIKHEPDAMNNAFGSVEAALTLPGTTADGIPVIGWALCFTLDVYGKAVEGTGKATGPIQEKLIAKNAGHLKNLNRNPALHMYTFEELKRETALDNDRDLRTLTKTLQITRLCRLLHTRQLTDAKDKPLD